MLTSAVNDMFVSWVGLLTWEKVLVISEGKVGRRAALTTFSRKMTLSLRRVTTLFCPFGVLLPIPKGMLLIEKWESGILAGE